MDEPGLQGIGRMERQNERFRTALIVPVCTEKQATTCRGEKQKPDCFSLNRDSYENKMRSVVEIREREIELKLRKATADRGGLCLKFTPTNWAGAPDRLVLLPGGAVGFVEIKAPGQRPRPLQVRRHTQLAELGYVVLVLDDPDRVDEVLDAIEHQKEGDENAQPG